MTIEISSFTTDDGWQADRALNDTYRPERLFSHHRRGAAFRYTVVAHRSGDLRVAHARHSAITAVDLPPVDGLAINSVSGGRLWCTTGGALAVRAAAGDVVMYPQSWRVAIGWDDLETEVVRLPWAAVEAAAAEVFGEQSEAFAFLDIVPMTPAGGRRWSRLSQAAHRALADPDSLLSEPVALVGLIDRLARAAVQTFPHTFAVNHHRIRATAVGSSALRRAAWFLESSVESPVTLADVASAVGVEARALGHAFRRAYGLTAMQYLERIRLEVAHRELELGGAAEDDTVADVAARTSFTSLASFSRAYARRFGTAPYDTLRRARERW